MKILLSAYSCSPDRGSESEVGWRTALELSRRHEVWVLTRLKNRRAIESDPASRSSNLHWHYHDLGPAWQALKKIGFGTYLYYAAWQKSALPVFRRLHAERGFDSAQHVTFANYWLPTSLSELGIPWVWGPVGGGEDAPRGFDSIGWLGLWGAVYERMRRLVRFVLDPGARAGRRAVRPIAVAANPLTLNRLEKLGYGQNHVLTQANTTALAQTEREDIYFEPGAFRVLSVGRILAWKGLALTAEALKRCRAQGLLFDWVIAGSGPDESRIRKRVERLGIADRVSWTGQVSRREVDRLMSVSHVLVHSSIHESGGMVCSEAMMRGLPVVCADHGGPGLNVPDAAGLKIPVAAPELYVECLKERLLSLASDRRRLREAGRQCREHAVRHLTWQAYGDRISSFHDNRRPLDD